MTIVPGSPSELRIERLPDSVERPFRSVMIPTYNCNDLLEQTLRCVLDQDPGVARMQVAVVDNGSLDE